MFKGAGEGGLPDHPAQGGKMRLQNVRGRVHTATEEGGTKGERLLRGARPTEAGGEEGEKRIIGGWKEKEVGRFDESGLMEDENTRDWGHCREGVAGKTTKLN